MDCRTFRKTLLTIRPADRDPSVCALLDRHEADCVDCAAFRRREEAVAAVLAKSPVSAAPTGFADKVMSRVDAGQAPSVSSWTDWLLGPLRAPSPGLSYAHAAGIAIVVVMLATAGLFVAHGVGPAADLPTAPVIAATSAPGGPAAAPVIDKESMDELIRRHQGSSVSQPLSDDEGMRLVSF